MDRNSGIERVYLNKLTGYQEEILERHLPVQLFDIIKPSDTVILKPNWVRESHIHKPNDWEYLITHPALITSVIRNLTERLGPGGRIIIADGPQTDSSFEKILGLNPVIRWHEMTSAKGIALEIIDLRDDEWIIQDEVIVHRKKLPGDPRGSTTVNLSGNTSEFHGQIKSKRGYYGADYNLNETNAAHNGTDNLYKVSKSVIEADIFINLPKLKTHKKAGITCCLKNLVGINTYKNYLPHYSEGVPDESGDQFPSVGFHSIVEGPLLAFIKQHFLRSPALAQVLKSFGTINRQVFGETAHTIRSGNWYGNDTIWRTILDLNKILFFANPDGSMRKDNPVHAKKYICIVDAILVGEWNGPLAPDPVPLGYLISGTSPVAVDLVAARLMGFDPMKIPAIRQAFQIISYPLCNITPGDIMIHTEENIFPYNRIPESMIKRCKPHFGWAGHIEIL